MSIEEAIEILQEEHDYCQELSYVIKALEMAIAALRAQQEVRDSRADTATCHYPAGMTIKLDGVHELDPCIYKVVEEHRNATVRVLQCKRCGHIEVEWERQEDTTDEEV